MTSPSKVRMEAMSEISLSREYHIPVEQDTVDFHGFPVIGVRLEDGRIGASLRDMCGAMRIDRSDQVQRISGDETIAECLISVQIQTRGGAQVTDILTAWAIPYWLTGVELSRIKDVEKRAAILIFKREAADILYQHFSRRKIDVHALIPQDLTQPDQAASLLEWAHYYERMALYYRWKHDTEMAALHGSVEDRLESQQQTVNIIWEIVERLGPETLSPEHQRKVQYMVKRLHDATGKAYGTIYDDLKTAFSVPKYADIPETAWDRVLNWFGAQTNRR